MSDKNNSGLEVVAWRITDGEGDYSYNSYEPERFSVDWAARYGRKHEPLVRLSDAEAALASAKKEIASWVKTSEAEDEFNTSLVAVNAELVEALRYCVEALQDNLYADDYLTTLAVARAALLKAEGAKS